MWARFTAKAIFRELQLPPRAKNETMTAVRPILCVGLVCLDIVNFCEKYPAEDEDIRASEQRWVAGGNAANSCTVLSLIGTACEFVGTLGHGVETE